MVLSGRDMIGIAFTGSGRLGCRSSVGIGLSWVLGWMDVGGVVFRDLLWVVRSVCEIVYSKVGLVWALDGRGGV